MKQDTKQKIIQAGAKIIHRKGYNHTGIQEVLKAAGVPKGSFYFYFNNKEDFGLHVIDFFNNMLLGMVEPVISDKNISPVRLLEIYPRKWVI
jgi:TetR/AcrR family transcriptional repressor of nem operon